MKIGSWGWRRRLGFLNVGLGFGLAGLGACGRPVATSEPPPAALVQPNVPEPEPVPVPEPELVAPEATVPEPATMAEPTPASPVSLSTTSCDAFDPEQLVVVAKDQDCDANTPETCPRGTHIDWIQGSPCASCVADSPENRTCAWATTCFEPFVQSIAHASGAKSCARDEDCSLLTVTAGCGPKLLLALKAHINEEIPMIASLYAQQNCSLCASSQGSNFDLKRTPVRCVNGACR